LELAAEHDISRMTARKAVTMLVTEGLLARHPGKGTFVAAAKVPAGATLASFSATMHDLGLPVTSRIINQELMTPPPRVQGELGLQHGEQVVFLRRLRCIKGEPVAIMSSYMPAAYYAALLGADLRERPLSEAMESVNPLRIRYSRDHLEAALARPGEAELLGIREGAPVLLQRGIVYAENGVAVRVSAVVYRGDRFRLSLSAEQAATQIRIGGPQVAIADGEPQWLPVGEAMEV
jgi:GntR family transcriptional regulator